MLSTDKCIRTFTLCQNVHVTMFTFKLKIKEANFRLRGDLLKFIDNSGTILAWRRLQIAVEPILYSYIQASFAFGIESETAPVK